MRKPESLGTQKGTVRTQPPSFRHSVLPAASGHPKWRISESKSKKHLCFSWICLLLSKRRGCKPRTSSPSHKHACAGDEPDTWASHEARTSGSEQSRKEWLKDSFIKERKKKKRKKPLPHQLGVTFKCFPVWLKFSYPPPQQKDAKSIWGKPESRLCLASWEQAERREISLGFTCASKEAGNGCPCCQPWGFCFGHTLLFVFRPLGGSARVHRTESVSSRTASLKTSSCTLSCPQWHVYQNGPFLSASTWLCLLRNKQNIPSQRIEYYLKGMWWDCFHHSSLSSLVPGYQLTVKIEQIGALGTLGGPRGWQAG